MEFVTFVIDITAVDKGKLEETMKEAIGIQETGGVGYITGLPSRNSGK
ncbi:hypothetical protein [Paenisporosarcina sp. NPDC076898]